MSNNLQSMRERLGINAASTEIILPKGGKTIAQFAKDVAKHVRGSEDIFWKPESEKFVEIIKRYEKLAKKSINKFSEISARRMLNILETKITTGYIDQYNNFKEKSATEQLIKVLMDNDDFRNATYQIDRILTSPKYYLLQGKLVLPKKGYDERLNSYLIEESPDIEDMNPEEAIKIIKKLLEEFEFKSEVDRTIAYAYIITPSCRGLYTVINERTPLFLIEANRPGVGKDLLAGCNGIIHKGYPREDPAISSKYQAVNDEELRKKTFAGLRHGEDRFHWSNCKGNIDSAVLEGLITAKEIGDRVLGKSSTETWSNELELSISANTGLTYSPDMARRIRKIRLHSEAADVTKRVFKKKEFHDYVFKNRSKLLSAINSLIKSWFEAGSPRGKTIYNGFNEWARVVGGIMQFHNLGDPCVTIEDDNIGGDYETKNLTSLWILMYESTIQDKKSQFKTSEIRDIIRSNQLQGAELFTNWDFEKITYRSSFGKLFRKHVGRIYAGIKMNIAQDNKKSERITYSFKLVDKKEAMRHTDIFDHEAAKEIKNQTDVLDFITSKEMTEGEMESIYNDIK